jgi:nucleotide-binding universal stress UspA family protein
MFRYRKILVPLDGSELAERALLPAVSLAQAMSAKVVLLRVVPPLIRDIHAERYRKLVLEISEDQAKAYLRSTRSMLASTPVGLVTKTKVGPVAESILACVQENDVDLIVMSSHGRSGISRWIQGSVAEKVLRHAPCATLIIPLRAEVESFTCGRIMVPLDGSHLAEQALEPALAVAEATNARLGATAELVALRVVAPIHLPVESVEMVHVFEQIDAAERGDAREYLHNLLPILARRQVLVKTEMLIGPIAESIVDYAASHSVDLIVMCTHGRSGYSRWFLGSVAEKVLRRAPCATLVIRGQHLSEQQDSTTSTLEEVT